MKCINCGNKSFYECDKVNSSGGHGPALLPGTGIGVFANAKFSIKICSECNFVHWFVNNEDMSEVKVSRKFTLREYDEE